MKKQALIRTFESPRGHTSRAAEILGKTIYYLLKIKGKAKIPDYVQIRDEQFTLIGYFRPDRKEKLSKTIEDPEIAARLEQLIDEIPYGKIEKVEI